jgi:hypothetical protein
MSLTLIRFLYPQTDGRPDPRPDVRENVAQLGDLVNDFDFTQPPRPPLILPTNPLPGPASIPGSWMLEVVEKVGPEATARL